MAQVKFVSGATARRIVDVSPKAKKLDGHLVAKAFNAREAGSSQGLDLFAVRNAMERMLQSSGGRPALQGANSQAKIPRINSDWVQLKALVDASSNLRHKPSVGQMAAIVLHLALGRIPESELREIVRRECA